MSTYVIPAPLQPSVAVLGTDDERPAIDLRKHQHTRRMLHHGARTRDNVVEPVQGVPRIRINTDIGRLGLGRLRLRTIGCGCRAGAQ